MRGEIRKCPICGAPIRRGRLMCLPHWRMVPMDMQRAINRRWKDWRTSRYGHPAISALGAYNRAYDAAVQAVFERIVKGPA